MNQTRKRKIIMNRSPLLLTALVVFFGMPSFAGQMPLRLQALVVTSGDHAQDMLDSNKKTGWQPSGDPDLEGALFRFEKPTRLGYVIVTPCSSSSDFGVIPFVNSVRGKWSRVSGATKIVLSNPKKVSIRSLFLRLDNAKPGACIAQIDFYRDEDRLDVLPPREVDATIEVSSTLKPEAAYHKSYLFDQSVDYGWVEGVAGLGVGESIVIRFAQPHEISGIQIYNGYQRSRDHFLKNARVAKIKISADGSKTDVMAVSDKMGPSLLRWESGGKVKDITMEIAAAKPGTKYKDLVISELRLMDKKGFFTVKTNARQALVSALKKDTKGGPLASLLDRSLESYCRLLSESAQISEDAKLGDFGLRKLKLRSNYRFVYYSQIAVDDEANIVSESIEGIWVPISKKEKGGKKTGPWSRIRLYARKQHVGQDIDESYEVITGNTKTSIVGGTLKIAFIKSLGRKGFLDLLRKWDKSPAAFKGQCRTDRDIYFRNLGRNRFIHKDDEDFKEFFDVLVKKNAVLVQGRAITDLFF